MKVKLLAPHIIHDRYLAAETVINLDNASEVSPLMLGLDPEAVDAIQKEKLRVFGRWTGRWPNMHLVDDPPIELPLYSPQPVPPIGGEGGPR